MRVPGHAQSAAVVRPMTAGISACETIQMMPKNMPPRIVEGWLRTVEAQGQPD